MAGVLEPKPFALTDATPDRARSSTAIDLDGHAGADADRIDMNVAIDCANSLGGHQDRGGG
jgi:hypothetical protein